MKNRLHVKAPGNWVNDPNGMIYYKGQYHLFYQHFPYAPRWGTMHWGHAVSPDLIHWEHVGVALFPSLSEDQNGCFSGSAVEENGVMHLFYTGVHYNQVNPKDIHQCLDQDFTSAQLHLTSKDGMHFDVFGDKEVVIPALTDPEIGDICAPFIFNKGFDVGESFLKISYSFCGSIAETRVFPSSAMEKRGSLICNLEPGIREIKVLSSIISSTRLQLMVTGKAAS